MKSWISAWLTLVGMGGSLLSIGGAFAAEESSYCAEAGRLAAQDEAIRSQCAMIPHLRVCTTTVAGKVYSGRAYLCESPLTPIYQALCREGVPNQGPLEVTCSSEFGEW